MLDGVAHDAIDPRSGIDLRDAVRFGERPCRNLAGGRLFALGGGGKGKYAAGANSQYRLMMP